jgi:hypothetical protein
LPLVCACSAVSGDAAASGGELVVSEIVSSNKRSLVDDALGTPDWIELYNPGSTAIDLSGYGVSDNLKDLHKYVVPDGTSVGPGEYLILYASGADEDASAAAYCTGSAEQERGLPFYYGQLLRHRRADRDPDAVHGRFLRAHERRDVRQLRRAHARRGQHGGDLPHAGRGVRRAESRSAGHQRSAAERGRERL